MIAGGEFDQRAEWDEATMTAAEPASPAMSFALSPRVVEYVVERERVEVVFPFGDRERAQLADSLKAVVPSAAWDGTVRVWWFRACVPSLREIQKWGSARGFRFGERLKVKARELVAEANALLVASRATDAPLQQGALAHENPGLAPGANFCHPAGVSAALRPYQVAGVDYMVRAAMPGCINGDEPGLGKTAQTLAALRELGEWPAVIVCPGSVKYHWAREATRWLGDAASVRVLEGTGGKVHSAGSESRNGSISCGPARGDSDRIPGAIYVVNYDILAARIDELIAREPGAVVYDELHWLKDPKTKRYQAAAQLSRAASVRARFGLSGTPLDARPSAMRPALALLGRLDEFGGWKGFGDRYCDAKPKRVGERWELKGKEIGQVKARALGAGRWEVGVETRASAPLPWRVQTFRAEAESEEAALVKVVGRQVMDVSGAKNLPELASRLRKFCMVRRLKRDVMPELPRKQRVVIDVELSARHAAEYRAAERDIVRWARTRPESGYRIPDRMSDADLLAKVLAEARKAAGRAAMNAPELVKMNALRKIAARGKLDAVCEWVGDFLESGKSEVGSRNGLVLFGWHVEIVEAIAKRFGVDPVTGDTPMRERDKLVSAFAGGYGGTRPPLFVANIRCAGTGLDGLQYAASDVAFIEGDWSAVTVDQAEDRVDRMGQVSAVTAWHFLARHSIDPLMFDCAGRKRDVASAGLGDRI